MTVKRIGFLVFPRLTLLDFVGGYDALRRVPLMGIDPEVTHRSSGPSGRSRRSRGWW